MCYDAVVIGAGVIGGLITRELSRYNLKIALVERSNDMAMGATKANSAIVHAGFDALPGTLKAKYNVIGTELMPKVCGELNVPFKQIGSLVLAFSEKECETLGILLERGKTNGVSGLEIIDADALKVMEPNISDNAVAALYAPSAGIVCPYELTIAAVENAVSNGADFIRNFEVTGIKFDGEVFTISSESAEIKSKYIINAAGTFSGEIASMIGDNSINIVPRKGEYMLCDKSVGNKVSHTIFQCPTEMGKGVLVTPTVDGNLLMGPTAKDTDSNEDTETTAKELAEVLVMAQKSVPSVSTREVITSFAGLRAHDKNDDFIIGKSAANNKFINAAGIESPGLSASPAIAIAVSEILKEDLNLEKKEDFNPVRPAPVRFRHLSNDERKKLIENNPAYGRIICRCETVTEGEIIDAINAPAGARDVDGVKRRTRAGMGRCQGGFCGSKVVEILARELNVEVNEITKFGRNSKILYERTK